MSQEPTEEPIAVPLVDIGNSLLRPSRATMNTGVTQAPDGTKMMVVTIRTFTTTLTLHFVESDAAAWADAWASGVRELRSGGGGLIIARGDLPPAPPNGIPNGMGLPSSRGGY